MKQKAFLHKIFGHASHFKRDRELMFKNLRLNQDNNLAGDDNEKILETYKVYNKTLAESENKSDDYLLTYIHPLYGEQTNSKEVIQEFFDDNKKRVHSRLRTLNFNYMISFIYFVSSFESTLSNLLFEFYQFSPQYMLGNKDKNELSDSLSFDDLIHIESKTDLIKKMADERVFKFTMQNIGIQLENVNKLFRTVLDGNASFPVTDKISSKVIGQTFEIFERRHMHLHNRGLINHLYENRIRRYWTDFNKRNPKNLMKLDDVVINFPQLYVFLAIDHPYINRCDYLFNEIINIILKGMSQKVTGKID